MNWRAIVVDAIKGLWDRGIRNMDVFLKPIYDAWLDDWVDWKTQQPMKELDKQIEEILEADEDLDSPVYTEDGEEIRLTAPWYDGTDD